MYEAVKAYCIYCHLDIDQDEPGWGFHGENDVFHTECDEMNEGIKL